MSAGEHFPGDPACGRRMSRNKAFAIVRYNKIEYHLCYPTCRSELEADPERGTGASAEPAEASQEVEVSYDARAAA